MIDRQQKLNKGLVPVGCVTVRGSRRWRQVGIPSGGGNVDFVACIQGAIIIKDGDTVGGAGGKAGIDILKHSLILETKLVPTWIILKCLSITES